jgi:YesN/AraC family two-component response regulator
MIRAFIADDEVWVRSLLKNMIDWKRLGIQLVGEASTGTDALAGCLKIHPDILITDIKMADLDGLELIHSLKTVSPELETIVISGHSDFAFAQRAIRESVCDYVLKPINKLEFEFILSRAVERIVHRRGCSDELEQIGEVENKVADFGTHETSHAPAPIIDVRIARVCEYLQENYQLNPSLTEASRLTSMNPTYFSEVFKREVGLGYSAFLLSIKMRSAVALLEETELKIFEIAALAGFSDSAYFSRVFKRSFLSSPEVYRKEHSAKENSSSSTI